MAKVLLTGATGFLGWPTMARLLAGGCELHALGRTAEQQAFAACPVEKPCFFHQIDLFDARSVSDVLESVRPTHLLHLAWIATPGIFWNSPDNHRWVDASLHLFREFCRVGGRRAVLVGSCAEYDWSYRTCSESSTPLRPGTLYGQSKLRLWEAVQPLAAKAGVSAAWARLFFLYGPREHPDRLVASVIRSLLRGADALCSAGLQQRDFLYVADVADALAALLASEIDGAINIGSGRTVALADVVRHIGATLGAAGRIRLGARQSPGGEPPMLGADITRLTDELGWKPCWQLREGLADTIAWWRTNTAAGAA